MDDYEPELNRMRPKDPRDTTTPRAIAADYQKLVLGDALTADKRALLKDWLMHSAHHGRQTHPGRASQGVAVADKTGTGDYGRANDIAIVWPPHTAPLVVASCPTGPDTAPRLWTP